MSGSLLLIGCMLLGQAGAAEEGLELEVRRLVRRLDSPQLEGREAAEEELIKLGPKILDLLPRPTDRTPAEVKQRIGRIRQKLQRATAESTARASLITLSGEAIPVSKVLASLEKLSGNKIIDGRDGKGQDVDEPKLKVGFSKTPFWQALDQVLDQAALTAYPYGQQRAINVVPRPETQLARQGRASYSGPFRIEATCLTARRDLRDPTGQVLRLTLEIAWEPRVSPISLRQRLADLEVVDPNGRPLVLNSPLAELEVPVDPQATTVELHVPMELPPREVKEIAKLKGTLKALLPGKIETFRFKNIMKAAGAGQRVAGVTVTLEKVRRNDEIWEVRMRVGFDQASGALESYRGWIFNNEASLVSPDGKTVPFDAFDTIGRTENEIGIAYLFGLEKPPAGYTFVYKTPGMIISTDFEYEINDLKLP